MSDVRGRFQRRAAEPVQELPDLLELIYEWTGTLKASKQTIAGYMVKISPFVEWFDRKTEFNKSDLKLFDDWLVEHGHSDKNRFEIMRRYHVSY